jgi:hypothetical protein
VADSPTGAYALRRDVIEALSWHEDMQRGRWGVEYATEVVEALEAQARRDGLAPVTPWCPVCFEAPEPAGPWAAPGDACADTHVLDWLSSRSDKGGAR